MGEVICKTASGTFLYTESGNVFGPCVFRSVAGHNAGLDGELPKHVGERGTSANTIPSEIAGKLIASALLDTNSDN